jgi:hypothetical protein
LFVDQVLVQLKHVELLEYLLATIRSLAFVNAGHLFDFSRETGAAVQSTAAVIAVAPCGGVLEESMCNGR